jgi:5-methylthioribose kinase
LIVKQSRPWVERFPQFEAPWARAPVEIAFYARVAQHPPIRDRMPRLLASDAAARLLVLEDLGASTDYSALYQGAVLGHAELESLAEFLSRLHALTPPKPVPELLRNREMRALNSQHIFFVPRDPHQAPDLDTLQPGLADAAAPLLHDLPLRTECIRLATEVYLVDGPTLVHGDFFPGSFLRSPEGPKIIDPEFGFFGRPEFDGAVLLAHLALARQPADLTHHFLACYAPPTGFDRRVLWQLCGAEIIRRLIGYAQLPLTMDLDQKAQMLAYARDLVLHPEFANVRAPFSPDQRSANP